MRLQQAGFQAKSFVPSSAALLRALRDALPDAFVIDLHRLPSQGRDLAILLRRQAATRGVPLVFVDGAPDVQKQLEKLLPDAPHAGWESIGPAVQRAVRDRPPETVMPLPMAAYAGSPLPKKLRIKPGAAVLLLSAPPGFEEALTDIPAGARLSPSFRRADLILLFARCQEDLSQGFDRATARLQAGGGIWVIWPKRASGMETDLTQSAVRRFGLERGFVDYKICAVDDTWSGLLFARRRAGAGRPMARR
jgi:CheY-like chemotaxis protein